VRRGGWRGRWPNPYLYTSSRVRACKGKKEGDKCVTTVVRGCSIIQHGKGFMRVYKAVACLPAKARGYAFPYIATKHLIIL
jgi:hypothetical protein